MWLLYGYCVVIVWCERESCSQIAATESPQISHRCPCYQFYVLLYFLTMGIVREQYSKCHSGHFFIYACADSSEWGLFSLSRSAWSPRPPSLFEAKSQLASPHSECVPSHSFIPKLVGNFCAEDKKEAPH